MVVSAQSRSTRRTGSSAADSAQTGAALGTGTAQASADASRALADAPRGLAGVRPASSLASCPTRPARISAAALRA